MTISCTVRATCPPLASCAWRIFRRRRNRIQRTPRGHSVVGRPSAAKISARITTTTTTTTTTTRPKTDNRTRRDGGNVSSPRVLSAKDVRACARKRLVADIRRARDYSTLHLAASETFLSSLDKRLTALVTTDPFFFFNRKGFPRLNKYAGKKKFNFGSDRNSISLYK